MPNWIRNQLIFETVEEMEVIRKHTEMTDMKTLNFDTIHCRPNALTFTHDIEILEALLLRYEKSLKDKSDTFEVSEPDNWKIAREYHSLKIIYKAPIWYNWNIQNWGTKWNATWHCDFSPIDIERKMLLFDTAWSAVPYLMLKLSSLYPDIKMIYRWADEDHGSNFGEIILSEGLVIDKYKFKDDEYQKNFPYIVWGYESEDDYLLKG